MSRPKTQVAAPKPTITCGYVDCGVEFTPQRSTAKYHSSTCRQRARRQRTAAAESAAAPADAEGGHAEHSLVRAVRLELERSDAVDTVDGQIALELARRLANPDESSPSPLAREMRVVLAKVADSKPAASGEAAADAQSAREDEVDRARRRREEKEAALAAAAAEQA